jgi:hypothetical protein
VPRIDLKEDVKKDSGLILKMIKDTETFRIDKMLSALKKTSDVATQYEIIVYLLKSFDELLPEQQASIINESNRLFKGETLIDKATVRLAKVLKGFTGDIKKSAAPKKFEEILSTDGEDQIIEI